MDSFLVQDDPSVQAASALPFDIPPTADGSYPEQFLTISQTVEASQPRPGLGGRELYSKEQWEIQKPIIRQLYNIENQPFKRVIDILQTKHNFFPTRRQFYRKISEWGYEKNIKDNEMRTISQHLDDRENRGEDLNVELKGQKIDPVKIHRWQKRHGKVKNAAYPSKSNSRDNASSQRIFSMVDELESHQENSRRPRVALNKCEADISQLPSNSEDRTMDSWNLVDVSGSPLLTRFFEALKLEGEKPIPYLDLNFSDQSAAVQSTAEPDSDEEMTEDVNPATWVDFSLGAASNDIVNYAYEILCSPYLLRTDLGSNPAELSFSEWGFREWDFSRGQPQKIDMKHLYGLSPYPAQLGTGRNKTSGRTDQSLYSRSLQIQDRETKIKMRLQRSKMAFGAEHPKTLLAARDLGNLYREQMKPRQAERLLRQVAVSYRKTCGLKHIETLHTYLDIIKILLHKGEILEARKIHQAINDIIVKLVENDNPLALRSTLYRTIMLDSDGYFDEAEMLIRDVLQILLQDYGLQDKITIHAMIFLSHVFVSQQKFAESERLLRIQLQISSKVEGRFSNESLSAVRSISVVLRKQERYDECRELATALVEQSQGSLPDESPEILSVLSDVAICARHQGQLLDSEHQLRTILERQIRCMGVEDPDVLYTMDKISYVLSAMGRPAEAIILLERVYKQSVKSSSLKDVNTLNICRHLARTYVNLGRLDDAMALLKHNVDHTGETGKYQTAGLLNTKRLLADLLWRKGDYKEAITLYKDAATVLEQRFRDAINSGEKRSLGLLDIVVDLARSLRKTGEYAKAVTCYEECLTGFPEVQMSSYNSYEIQYGLPICYEELGRYDDWQAFCDKHGSTLGIEEVDQAPATITLQNP